MKEEFDITQWLLDLEVEETANDLHYSIYYTPDNEGNTYETN